MGKEIKRSSPKSVKSSPTTRTAPIKPVKPKRSGAAAKQSNNSTFSKLESPLKPLAKGERYQPGSYAGGRAQVTVKGKPSKTTPSRAPIEVDHISPESGHRSGTLSKSQLKSALPAALMNKTQHRQKLTTGSSTEADRHRNYLRAAHQGMVPFTGPMNDRQDHYAAAMQTDLSHTTTPSTLFGKPTLHDPRVPKASGDVPIGDARWGLASQRTMVDYAHGQGLINEEGKDRMHGLLNETDNNLPGLYQEHGKRTG